MRTCLVGMLGSGKSTALAALWFSVVEKSDLCEWYLSPHDRPIDSSHWTALRDRWLEGEPLIRTEHTPMPDSLKLKLSKNNGDEKLEILVPDIAGEDFQKLYELGRFPKKHATLIENAEHIVFFLHVGHYDVPVKLKAPDENPQTGDPEQVSVELQEFSPDQMYQSSKNIAVLMGIRQLLKTNMPRLTVVLTAWDLIKDGSSPEKVLKRLFPLLDQYLRTNFAFTLLGVSAQGCDYEDPTAIEGIELDNIERISVIGDKSHNDISLVFA